MTLSIRTLTADDLNAADAVLMAAYSSPSRKRELARYLALHPDGWLLAELDGALVGVVGATSFGAFAYIGLMAVAPDMQRRGIGRALMERLLERIASWGVTASLLDASDAGYPLYAQLGFVEDDTVSVYARQMPQGITPEDPEDEALAPVRPVRPNDLPALVAFDTPRFGANREAVLATYLGEFVDRAFLSADDEGLITGFLLAQRWNLGPWMASTLQGAEALLAAALALPFDRPPTALAPAANPHAEQLLRRFGFAPTRTLRHMRLGGSPRLTRRIQMYGQASFALG